MVTDVTDVTDVTVGIAEHDMDDAAPFNPTLLDCIIKGDTDAIESAEVFIEGAKNNSRQLQAAWQQLDDVIKTLTDIGQAGQASPLIDLRGQIRYCLRSAVPPDEPRDQPTSKRIEDVRFEVEQQPLRHTFDLNRFTDRVVELFEWHNKKDQTVRNKFMAPYFPLVQSSGMGKTKLLFEFRNMVQEQQDERVKGFHCRTILCVDSDDLSRNNESDPVFSDEFVVPKKGDIWQDVCRQLNDILGKCEATDVVLLFDETQILLASNGRPFRSIRWWLKQKDGNKKNKNVVAVFTGTTLRLTNFYAGPSTITSNSTRDGSETFHDSGSALYPPFYIICTIGLFAPKGETIVTQPGRSVVGRGNVSDYEKAIPHGRPLFALMHKTKPIHNDDEKMFKILTRMLLKSELKEDLLSTEACLSILGTRIQMGQTTVALTSELVSRGYAILTYYSSAPFGNSIARLTFPTDPVCAHLAMGMMDESWSLHSGRTTICGNPKTFWVSKMSEIFSTGLCLASQGNIGELAGALYLLFCGDVLRKKKDHRYMTFSVSLSDFVKYIVRPNEFCRTETDEEESDRKIAGQKRGRFTDVDDKQSDSEPRGGMPLRSSGTSSKSSKQSEIKTYKDAHISFIQVVANYLRDDDITDQGILRNMFESGCAYYTYPMCDYIDMVGSIRLIDSNSKEHYVPLLVSISTIRDKGSQQAKLDSMTSMLRKKKMFGFCIRLLFAHPEEDIQNMEDIMTENDVNILLHAETVSKVVVVPHDDPFGLVAVLLEAVALSPPECEVYSSHYFMQLKDYTPKSIVRNKHTDELLKFVTGLLEAIGLKKATGT